MYSRNVRIFAFIILIVIAAGLANFMIFDMAISGLSAKQVMIVLIMLGLVSFIYLLARQKQQDS